MPQFHLIAPSGYCINQEAAQRGVQRLLEMGHQVENQTIIPRRMQRFAGTEAQRLSDIKSLATLEGENTIVLAVRGGYGASRLLKLPHDIAAPAGMIGASNFFELAVAVAISLFGAKSPVALATIVGVLVEVPVMLTLVKIANRTTHWFPSQTSK